jgi:hypothetical protein
MDAVRGRSCEDCEVMLTGLICRHTINAAKFVLKKRAFSPHNWLAPSQQAGRDFASVLCVTKWFATRGKPLAHETPVVPGSVV